MDRGVIYIATGPAHVAEALTSAASVKRHMPDLPITLFSDRGCADPNIDRVIRIEPDPSRPSSATKHTHIGASPYRESLYLDSDTYMCGKLDDLFTLLETFDLAAAHAPMRAMHEIDAVPDCFPEFNCGVILFRRSAAVDALFSQWADAFARNLDLLQRDQIRWLHPAHERAHALGDQGAFREALYRSPVRFATLPPEYNCRFSVPGFVDGPVKILHGRGDRSVTCGRAHQCGDDTAGLRGTCWNAPVAPIPGAEPGSLQDLQHPVHVTPAGNPLDRQGCFPPPVRWLSRLSVTLSLLCATRST